jgi:glucose/arabinose dehydrogenase/PKD repeat protein
MRARSTSLPARLVVSVIAALAIAPLGLPVGGPTPAAAADPNSTACPKGFLTTLAPARAAECATTSPHDVSGQAPTLGLPTGFQQSVVWSGLTNPMAIRFAADGRVFVIEKFGRIKIFDSLSDPTPTTYQPASFQNNVFSYWDRGLLGLALDPSLTGGSGSGNWVYVLYSYDHILDSGVPAPRWGDSCPTPPGPTTDGCVVSARLSRFAVSGSTISGPEQPLIEDWCQQFPSHSIGSLVFGPDGALYVGSGDGASFIGLDYGQRGGTLAGTPTPVNPCGDPPGGAMTPPAAEGGALRSQDMRTSGDAVGLDGTILRVDPDTGFGMAGNPFAGNADPNARRIIAYGLRNPFRFTARPGTNELWLGEVGFETWEEIDRIPNMTDGVAENFGWPCHEGAVPQSGYDGANLTLCENLYAAGPGAVRGPEFAYNHDDQVVPGEGCPTGSSSLSGMAFYPEAGGTFPVSYRGGLFFADYSRDCIWFVPKGGNGQPDFAARQTFVDGASNPVDLAVGPDGFLYYVDFGDLGQPTGAIWRIIPPGSNQPPIASFTATPSSGPPPLDVQFDATASSDPEGGPLTYAWDLDGDGQYDDAVGVTTSRTYSTAGNVTVRLRVTDGVSATGTTSHVVMVGNGPPVPVISAPSASLTWKVGDLIAFSGSATDPQDGALPASALSWTLRIQHCPSTCHTHVIQTWNGTASGSFNAPDHDYPSYLELVLTATDSFGTSASVVRRLNPKTVRLGFATSPTGLRLVVNGSSATTPFSRTVIVGSSVNVTATSPQTIATGTYAYASWSDGKAQTHQIDAPATDKTYTATFHATKLTIRPLADAQVKSGHPGTNYGASSTLRVREAKARTYLKFVVDGLTRPPTSAKIRLWVTNPGPDAGRVYRVPTTWTETGITWNNAPGPAGGVVDYAGPAATGTWLIVNVTPAITGDGRFAFVIRGGTSNLVDFASSETTHDPLLVIIP